MKKLLIVVMMCLMSTVTFAKEISEAKKLCTAHYYLTVHQEGKPDMLLYSYATSDNCADALAQAKSQANDMIELYF